MPPLRRGGVAPSFLGVVGRVERLLRGGRAALFRFERALEVRHLRLELLQLGLGLAGPLLRGVEGALGFFRAVAAVRELRVARRSREEALPFRTAVAEEREAEAVVVRTGLLAKPKQYLYCPGARQLYHSRKIND